MSDAWEQHQCDGEDRWCGWCEARERVHGMASNVHLYHSAHDDSEYAAGFARALELVARHLGRKLPTDNSLDLP